MRFTIAAVLASAIVLPGCTQGLPGLRPLSYASAGEARIFLSEEACVHDENGKEFAGLLAAVATTAASVLLENFGTALKNGAAGGALPTVTATRNMTLEPGRIPRCITFIRGSFDAGTGKTQKVDWERALGFSATAQPEMQTRLASLHVPDLYRLDHFIEFRLVEAPERRALTYFPVFTLVAKSLDGSAKGRRDLSINVKFSRPGAQDAGGPVLLADRNIGQRYVLKVDPGSGRADYEAPWFTFPNGLVPKEVVTTGAGVGTDAAVTATLHTAGGITAGSGLGGAGTSPPPATSSQLVDPYSTTSTAIPVTVTVTVVETRPTNEALAFVASVFNGVRPQISSALGPILSSDVAATEQTADLMAQGEYATALGAAKTALIAYCETASTATDAAGRSERLTRSAAARASQLMANSAAIKTGAALPFTSIVVIGDGTVDATKAVGCTA
ncbi:hypothetical protein [Sphingomonas sp. RIT328]|uniref:hypothetical protein n=1 Tax=Sphingomonas sp. RIT328 TaxID=1470591 RepID=UPI00044F72CC|nr:hypothetical protein [Sphingomonas sp. RIT328]EZP50005.1 hypothetical protein BW41_03330 [Sphingomonas sp. RIT328]